MAHTVGKLITIWVRVTLMSAQAQLLTNYAGLLFVVGKIVRFILYFIFLFSVLSGTKTIVNFTREQIILFFLVFNLIDITVQFLCRGVYVFRPLVISGNYDLDLLKPLPSFFRPLFGWADILDLVTLVPFVIYFIFYTFSNRMFPDISSLFLFLVLIINSLVLALSFHLAVCAICILTTEVDHLIWVYRDLTNMARFPADIYQRAIQGLLIFPLPVIILMTVPAKALMGLLSWNWIGFSLIVGVVSMVTASKLWKYSLRRYSSASS